LFKYLILFYFAALRFFNFTFIAFIAFLAFLPLPFASQKPGK